MTCPGSNGNNLTRGPTKRRRVRMDAHGAAWTRMPANGHAQQRMDTHEMA